MGIKYFQKWIKTEYPFSISDNLPSNLHIDVLALDLNGIFHSTAQIILLNNKKLSSLLLTSTKIKKDNFESYLFENITKKINQLVMNIKPVKTLILCIDGVTGLCKINQQRQRRYKSAFLNSEQEFDTNNFSPGTKLMHSLGIYIDKFILHQSSVNPIWKNINIIFSNEKVPGEGEHKIFQLLSSSFPSQLSNVVIYGIDSDLVMLSLIAPSNLNIFILKELNVNETEFIHISSLRNSILKDMTPSFDSHSTLIMLDFILLSFLIGNDFLPSFDVLNIYDGFYSNLFSSYHLFFQQYSTICFQHEHDDSISFSYPKLKSFLSIFSNEKQSIENKYNNRLYSIFPDPIVLNNCSYSNHSLSLDFANYRNDYYNSKFPPSVDISSIVFNYLKGMLWNLRYYVTHDVPDWLWIYPYSFTPLLTDMFSIYDSIPDIDFISNEPIDPIFHLLCILPPNSSSLLPKCLQNISILYPQYYPQFIHIDLTGKRKEWEGIVILPLLSYSVLIHHYKNNKFKFSIHDNKRNIIGNNFFYNYP